MNEEIMTKLGELEEQLGDIRGALEQLVTRKECYAPGCLKQADQDSDDGYCPFHQTKLNLMVRLGDAAEQHSKVAGVDDHYRSTMARVGEMEMELGL